jgi:hypothetical protein
VDLVAEIHGQQTTLDIAITVRDVGWGGFSVESAMPFPVGCRHSFQFWSSDGRTTMASAECWHCTPANPQNGRPMYVSGFSFVPQRNSQLQTILSTFAAPPEKAR